MQTYLNKGIKDVINEFPAIEQILDEYGIGCGPCEVGICQLKDVVQIHRLDADREKALMARIEKAIYPDRNISVPTVQTVAQAEPQAPPQPTSYSPPVRKLVDEHVLIKRWLALIPQVVKHTDISTSTGRQLVLDGVDLIRAFADRCHHGKEEDILFKYFDDTVAIFQSMYADHRQARQHVKTILEALEKQDRATVSTHLTAYGELLHQHIRKEDEILFPWIDSQLSTSQVGELFTRFNQADEQSGIDPAKYEKFITRLENQFSMQGAIQ